MLLLLIFIDQMMSKWSVSTVALFVPTPRTCNLETFIVSALFSSLFHADVVFPGFVHAFTRIYK